MTKATPISLEDAFATLAFLGDRTPESTPEEKGGAFATLSDYRDGAVFIAHYAGESEWERHSRGDEIVLVVEGETTLFLWTDGEQIPSRLRQGQLFVVPENAWHRFESPDGVKILTVTPQPTEHRTAPPEEG